MPEKTTTRTRVIAGIGAVIAVVTILWAIRAPETPPDHPGRAAATAPSAPAPLAHSHGHHHHELPLDKIDTTAFVPPEKRASWTGIEGTVDSPEGLLKGAIVTAVAVNRHNPTTMSYDHASNSVSTDATGCYRLSLRPGVYLVKAEWARPGVTYYDLLRGLRPTGPEKNGLFYLREGEVKKVDFFAGRGAAIKGSITEEDGGKGIENVLVIIQPMTRGGVSPSGVVRTDAQGRFSLRGVADMKQGGGKVMVSFQLLDSAKTVSPAPPVYQEWDIPFDFVVKDRIIPPSFLGVEFVFEGAPPDGSVFFSFFRDGQALGNERTLKLQRGANFIPWTLPIEAAVYEMELRGPDGVIGIALERRDKKLVGTAGPWERGVTLTGQVRQLSSNEFDDVWVVVSTSDENPAGCRVCWCNPDEQGRFRISDVPRRSGLYLAVQKKHDWLNRQENGKWTYGSSLDGKLTSPFVDLGIMDWRTLGERPIK